MTQIEKQIFEQAVRDMRATRDMRTLLLEGVEKSEEIEIGTWAMANCLMPVIRLKAEGEKK